PSRHFPFTTFSHPHQRSTSASSVRARVRADFFSLAPHLCRLRCLPPFLSPPTSFPVLLPRSLASIALCCHVPGPHRAIPEYLFQVLYRARGLGLPPATTSFD